MPKMVDRDMEKKISIGDLIMHLLKFVEISHGFDLMHAEQSIRSVAVF